MLRYELTRWWAYRRIKDPMMRHYLWTAPLALCGIAIAAYALLPIKPNLSGQGGLLTSASQVLALVPGFFITALAAVATFNRSEMDETMPDPSPTSKIFHRGKMVEIHLTRRMFLSYLFSYLSVLAVILFATSAVAPLAYPSFALLSTVDLPFFDGEAVLLILKYGFMIIFSYFIFSLFISTLHGIYFLCERILMPTT